MTDNSYHAPYVRDIPCCTKANAVKLLTLASLPTFMFCEGSLTSHRCFIIKKKSPKIFTNMLSACERGGRMCVAQKPIVWINSICWQNDSNNFVLLVCSLFNQESIETFVKAVGSDISRWRTRKLEEVFMAKQVTYIHFPPTGRKDHRRVRLQVRPVRITLTRTQVRIYH